MGEVSGMTDFQFQTTLKLVAGLFSNCKTIEDYEKAVQALHEIAGQARNDGDDTA